MLIIIGIILAAAVKSLEILDNARAKRILSQIVVLADAQNQFYERTFRYAGDTNNDGGIDYTNPNATYNAFDTTSGINTAFDELKKLDILGSEKNIKYATLANGGPAYYASYRVNSIPINILAIRNVPCLTAFQMELNLDKNQPGTANSIGTGRVRWFSVNNANSIKTGSGAWTASDICGSGTGNTNIMYLFDRIP